MIIPNMYRTNIRCSNYNVVKGTEITVKVSLKDFNGVPVIGENVLVLYDDNTSVYAGNTGNDGLVSFIFTCNEVGFHVFSVNDVNISFYVYEEPSSWKSIVHSERRKLNVKDDLVEFILTYTPTTNVTATSSWKNIWSDSTYYIPTKYRKDITLTVMDKLNPVMLRINRDNGSIQYRSATGDNVSCSSLYGYWLYRIDED